MSTSNAAEEQKIRAVIDTWAAASADADLIALANLMTEDVAFLTQGQPPMRRKQFFNAFAQMSGSFTITSRSICWSYLEVEITPVAGGNIIKRAGNILTVFRRGTDGQWRIWRDANLLALV
jgi:ketosteroid isomerase-like protein